MEGLIAFWKLFFFPQSFFKNQTRQCPWIQISVLDFWLIHTFSRTLPLYKTHWNSGKFWSVQFLLKSDQTIWEGAGFPDKIVVNFVSAQKGGGERAHLFLTDFAGQILTCDPAVTSTFLPAEGAVMQNQFTWLILSSVIVVIISDRSWPNNIFSVMWFHLSWKFVSAKSVVMATAGLLPAQYYDFAAGKGKVKCEGVEGNMWAFSHNCFK